MSGLISEARGVVGSPWSLLWSAFSHRYDETFRFFLCSSGCIDQVFFNTHKLSTLKAIDWRFFHDF